MRPVYEIASRARATLPSCWKEDVHMPRTTSKQSRPIGAAAMTIGASLLFLAISMAAAAAAGQASRLVESSSGRMLRGPGSWLGVTLRDLTPVEADRWQLSLGGAVIEDVVDGSPAWRASLRAGDVISTFDGFSVRDARDLSGLIRDTPPGQTVKARVSRVGTSWETDLTPEDEPATLLRFKR